jgi:hypothetical protein
MEVVAMMLGAAVTALGFCVWRLWKEVENLREKCEATVVSIADEVMDAQTQTFEENWQKGMSNIMGYDMTAARKAGHDE